MEFNFDIRGYLKPYGKNIINVESLKAGFVDPFNEGSSRKKLYKGYVKYNTDLKRVLSNKKYYQWINGSFISTKVNPRDIDMVNFIDFELAGVNEKELKRFTNRQSKVKYGIDGYIVRIYPEAHKNFIRTKSDLIYWENWFGMSAKNRRKQRYPKGFVELEV